MIASEAAQVLTLAAAYDGRTVTPETSIAWAAALERIQLDPALEAVKIHYRSTRQWMMPADVATGAARIQQQREIQAHGALSHRERSERACAVTACACTHTHCTRGWLDAEETTEREGRVYAVVRRCPKCADYAEAKAAMKAEGW